MIGAHAVGAPYFEDLAVGDGLSAPGVTITAGHAALSQAAIGRSTAPSARVLGDLFDRGLGWRPVAVGTTLRTHTEVVARRAASHGRGIVALRVTTVDQDGRPVPDPWRCPLRPAHAPGDDEPRDVLDWTLVALMP